MKERASTSRLAVFILLGFTFVLAIVSSLARIIFSWSGAEVFQISPGTAPLYMLLEGLVAALPVSLVVMFYLHLDLKTNRIRSVMSFVKAVFVAMIAFFILFLLYMTITRGIEAAQDFAPFTLMLIPLGVIAGALLWMMRSLFGVKVL